MLLLLLLLLTTLDQPVARGTNGTVCFEGGIHWFVCSILWCNRQNCPKNNDTIFFPVARKNNISRFCLPTVIYAFPL